MRRFRTLLGAAVVMATIAGCGAPGGHASPVTSLPPDPADAVLHAQAQADLARWAKAVAAAGPGAFQPTGELVGQIGDWELAVGGNNKSALYAGMLVAAVGLPTAAPPDATIAWKDGSSTSARVLSATDALAAITATADGSCPACTPLQVTGARLITGSLATSRGPATVPMWAFSVAGTAVQVTRVAVADQVTVVPPPWDANHPPIGYSIGSAKVSADGLTLTVEFVGSPDDSTVPCGEDYIGEAVESDLAVVVILHVVEYSGPPVTAPPSFSGTYHFGCRAVGFDRHTTVRLAAPLGTRAVLEVKEGLPVPVTRG